MSFKKLYRNWAFVPALLGLLSLSLLGFTGTQDTRPKNIIIMISDGCGYNHVEAARIYQYGKAGMMVFEKFPVKMAAATYPANVGIYEPEEAWKSFNYVKRRMTDSAAAATAYATGELTYNGAIGMDVNKKRLTNSFEVAEKAGKATGVVTSVQFSHATPAGFIAHNVSRGNYEEIAKEMILQSGAEVIMGCGNPWYDENGVKRDKADTYKYVGGEDTWTLLTQGKAGSDCDYDGKPDYWNLIQGRSEFKKMASGDTPKRVIGIPMVANTLSFDRKKKEEAAPFDEPLIPTVPVLSEMSAAALNVLDNDPDGFTLMIEGGAVDWAAHANNAPRVIEEEIEFEKAVKAVISWVEKYSSWDETLLIVSADHETGYLTGPGSKEEFRRNPPVWNPLTNNGKGKLPGMQFNSGTHTNSLVPVYAKGKGAEKLREYVRGNDPRRGDYIHTSDIGKLTKALLE